MEMPIVGYKKGTVEREEGRGGRSWDSAEGLSSRVRKDYPQSWEGEWQSG